MSLIHPNNPSSSMEPELNKTSNIATSQLLNIPTSILTVLCIGIFGIWANSSRPPPPLYPLSFLIVILACYAVL